MSFITYIIRRLMAIPITLFLITAILYGIVLLAPLDVRVELYMPKGQSNNPNLNPEVLRQKIIEEKGLNDPYPVQYARWLGALLHGEWGWSPGLRDNVLHALLVRTPATAELTFYSILVMIPLGLIGGVYAGWKQNAFPDYSFRFVAFAATSIPPFILGLVLLSIFYAGLRWFPPGRLSYSENAIVMSDGFRSITGFITLDGLLNGRVDITQAAFRHLLLPVLTLGLAHWATLGRITRVTIVEELRKDYIITARGKGLHRRVVVWRHALRNALVPGINSTALSAASLVMGVFVVEVVFDFPGVSEIITDALGFFPDVPAALGFAVYSVLLVLPVMITLDIVQAALDPRIRERGALQ